MQVWPCRPTGLTNSSDQGPFANSLTFFNQNLAEVDIDRPHAKPMINLNCFAGKKHTFMGKRDDPIRCREDRGSCWRCNINAQMRCSWLTVKNALTAVDTRDPTPRRPNKPALKVSQLGYTVPGSIKQIPLTCDSLVVTLFRRDFALGQTINALNPIIPFPDFQCSLGKTSVFVANRKKRARFCVPR